MLLFYFTAFSIYICDHEICIAWCSRVLNVHDSKGMLNVCIRRDICMRGTFRYAWYYFYANVNAYFVVVFSNRLVASLLRKMSFLCLYNMSI